MKQNTIKKTSISFYTIDWPCGNLYLDENFIEKIDKEHRQACLNQNWFNNPKIKNLLGEADHVVLALRVGSLANRIIG